MLTPCLISYPKLSILLPTSKAITDQTGFIMPEVGYYYSRITAEIVTIDRIISSAEAPHVLFDWNSIRIVGSDAGAYVK